MKNPIIEFFCLEDSEYAREYQQINGKIKTIEDLETYLRETFDNPLSFVLETMSEYLEDQA